MKDFVGRFKRDLAQLQKTIEKESEDILKKVKKAANEFATNQNIAAKRKEIEKLIEARIKKLEPTWTSLMKEVKKSANNYGINVDALEKKVQTTFKKAKTNLGKRTAKAKGKKGRSKKTSQSSSSNA
jgi:hypothetical protein